jgi:hypothetical protein
VLVLAGPCGEVVPHSGAATEAAHNVLAHSLCVLSQRPGFDLRRVTDVDLTLADAELCVSDHLAWVQAGLNRDELRKRVTFSDSEFFKGVLASDPRTQAGAPRPHDAILSVLWMANNQGAMTHEEALAAYSTASRQARFIVVRVTSGQFREYFTDLLLASKQLAEATTAATTTEASTTP